MALGYRNRTDLASSLQFTVRTLADIEHGVRKASAGTYAMLENKLAWAPGSIDTILAGGEPKEVVELHRTKPTARPGIRTAPDQPQRPVAGVHRGIAAGAATAHHRPPRQTPRDLGRLGRRPRPARRLARRGLAAPAPRAGGSASLPIASGADIKTVQARVRQEPRWTPTRTCGQMQTSPPARRLVRCLPSGWTR